MAGFVNSHNMEKFLLPSSRELWKLSKLSFRVLRCYAIHTVLHSRTHAKLDNKLKKKMQIKTHIPELQQD